MHPLLRFTLDLFEPNQPVAQVDHPLIAIKKVAKKATSKTPSPAPVAPAAVPLVQPEAPGAIHFHHPRASREVRLGHALVAFEFKRGQRRSIGFSVGAEGLAVRAPKWVTLSEVDAALKTKADWILRKLQESRERHARLATQVIEWRDGASLSYLGQPVTIQLDPEHRFGAAGVALVPLPDAAAHRMPMPAGGLDDATCTGAARALTAEAGTPKPMPAVLLVSLPSHAISRRPLLQPLRSA